jgi:gas vesicle protein GvpL/GvpF
VPSAKATYVYCVVAATRRPRVSRVGSGLPATGPVRLLDVDRGLFLVVSDAPLSRYGEAAIERGLSDLDWVSRAAVAHEAVIESFVDADAVLPMKLFTIFHDDERAIAHVSGDLPRIRSLVRRLGRHHEWGVRVALDRTRASALATPVSTRRRNANGASRAAPPHGKDDASGLAYLSRKKAQRDASMELAVRAQETVAALYDRCAAHARLSKRRSPGELPVSGGPLLLDAAFLVPRARSRSFETLVAREARALAGQGYLLTLTGPWPPYSFVQE